MIKYVLKKIAYSLILLLLIGSFLVYFFLNTRPGLFTAIKIAQLFYPGSIQISKVEGRLVDSFSIEQLNYTYKNTHLQLNKVHVDWKFQDLLRKQVPIHAEFNYLNQLITLTMQFELKYPHTLSGTIKSYSTDLKNKLNLNLGIGGDVTQFQWSGEFQGAARGTIAGNLKQGKEFYQVLKWRDLHWQIDAEKFINLPEGRLLTTGTLPDVRFELNTNPGVYEPPKESMLPELKFTNSYLNANLTKNGLSGKGSLVLQNNTALNLNFILPNYQLKQGLSPDQAIAAELSFAVNSLDFIKEINPEIHNLKGQIKAVFKAQGTFAKPKIESQISLNNTSCTLPNLGITLDNIDLRIQTKDLNWQASGIIQSQKNQLKLTGQGPITKNLGGELRISGNNFPIVTTKEYQIHVSPDLKLYLSYDSVHITGAILVPFAKINPHSFTNSITLSDDVVYANQNEAPVTDLNTSMDVRIDMGKEVELTYKGLHTSLDGSINVKQLPQGPINANGELKVRKGQYKAYGQDLAIEQGQLIFTGGSLTNPGINLRASKKINNEITNTSTSGQTLDLLQNNTLGARITVGVEVTGRLSSPRVQLFANPAILSQADILSMLVLGRPASQANKAGGQLLLAAISSMNLGSGSNASQLIEQLKQNYGFDLNLQTNTNYNQTTNQFTDSTAVVVSKSLSKKLSVSYNVGLSQADPNIMTLKYLINKFLSIQVTSSVSANGIDFLYTRSSKDKTHER
ncbi:MAG: translocation/assembly module TamB domain-containing protein [Legionella sp.]|jgi:translocation and assembly module TamB